MVTSPMVMLLDGGYGEELKKRKRAGDNIVYSPDGFGILTLLETPEAIIKLHRDYIQSGATVITTASFPLTRYFFERMGRPDLVKRQTELMQLSVDLAREAINLEHAEGSVRIAASIPPLGSCYTLRNNPSDEHARREYRLIARALKDADIFLCETMSSMQEAMLAVDAVREVASGKPIWLSYVPRAGGALVCGTTIEVAVLRAEEKGVEAFLFNCGTPELIGESIREVARTVTGVMRFGGYGNYWDESAVACVETTCAHRDETKPLVTEQTTWNELFQSHVRGEDLQAERYADLVEQYINLGATIVGGCCGIGPDVIRAVHQRIIPSPQCNHS